MRDIIRLGLILLVITSIAGLVLGITNEITQAVIQERAELANQEIIRTLLPEAQEFNKVEEDHIFINKLILEVYEGLKDEKVIGYTVKTVPQGYGGKVEVLIGIDIDGKITGVKIGGHTETPGLGSKIEEPTFINQFIGKETGNTLTLTKNEPASQSEIQSISGATVSSRAVTEGINAAIRLFEDVLKTR